jgi:very-short-patch-repair endonuclease
MRCPIHGTVSHDSLPTKRAAQLVEDATVDRIRRRGLPATVSPAEVDLGAALLFYGLEDLHLQHPVGAFDLDVYWATFRLGIEVDGRDFHDQKTDERRDVMISKHGIMVLRIPAADVWHDPLAAARVVFKTAAQKQAA